MLPMTQWKCKLNYKISLLTFSPIYAYCLSTSRVLCNFLQLACKLSDCFRTPVKSRGRVLKMTNTPLCVSLNGHQCLDRVHRRIDFGTARWNHSRESLQQTYIISQ